MPMLERTAAGLEQRGLQRVLPPTTTSSLRSCRKLHTTFWHHGAADIVLSEVWQALMRGPLDSLDTVTPSTVKTESLNASSFLLDFLYPKGTTTLLRGFVTGYLDWPERQRRYLRHVSPRLYTSSAVSSTPPTQSAVEPSAENRKDATPSLGRDFGSEQDISEGGFLGNGEGVLQRKADADSIRGIQVPDPDSLRRLLTSYTPTSKADKFDEAWILYRALDPDQQVEFRVALFNFLATSTRVAEAWKLSDLYVTLDPDDQQGSALGAVVKAQVILDKPANALSLFKRGLTTKQSTVGIGALLAHTLKTSSWDMLNDLWTSYLRETGKQDIAQDELNELKVVPDLGKKLVLLSKPLVELRVKDSQLGNIDNVAPLLASIVKMFLGKIHILDGMKLVRRLKDPLIYEDFIGLCVRGKQKFLAAQSYREYRKLPDVKVRIFILRSMVEQVFFPHDPRGMEDVLKDWYRRYGKLDYGGYMMFLRFYADRGDVTSAYRLWNEFTGNYPKVTRNNPSVFIPLLKAHAERHELEQVEGIMDEMRGKYGVEPSTTCWNVLLHTHLKMGDFDAAVNVFKELCETVTPDDYSFGTLMQYAGRRGDLDFTLELYRMAKRKNIKLTVAIIDSLVKAYCQNDLVAIAENLCSLTTKSKKASGDYVALWNTLLQHHADCHDLSSVNRILEVMTDFQLTYNDQTYNALLAGLANVKQTHHALHLLQTAREERIFEPTARHYILLMSAALGTREPQLAIKVNRLLHERGFRQSSDQFLMVMKAMGRWKSWHSKDQSQLLGRALRTFFRSLTPDKAWQPHAPAGLFQTESVAERFSLMIFLFVQMKDFAPVDQLVDLYRKSFMKDDAVDAPLPTELLSAIMLSDFHQGRFRHVKSTWGYLFENAQLAARPTTFGDFSQEGAGPSEAQDATRVKHPTERAIRERHMGEEAPRVISSSRYALNDCLKTMQRTFEAQGDADGLKDLIKQVTAAGFQLDSKNWNYYVQILARLKQWGEAFSVCEEKLMPQWGGWKMVRAKRSMTKNQLSLEQRRLGTSPRFNRPISHTLFVLAKEYFDLEKMMPWSREAEGAFTQITESCNKTVNAIRQMLPGNTELEARIFSKWSEVDEGSSPLSRKFDDAADVSTEQVDLLRPFHSGGKNRKAVGFKKGRLASSS